MKKLFAILILISLGMPAFAYNAEPIRDELLDPNVYYDSGSSAILKAGIYKQGEFQNIPIKDELIDDDFISHASNFKIIKKEHPDDFFFEKNIDTSKARKIMPKIRYDFTKKQIPVEIQLAQQFKTKGLLEGSEVNFVATHDFEINNRKFEKGTPIIGRVETLSASDKMGVPETLKIDNFYIDDKGHEINLSGSVSKTGANRSIWVYPLYQAGNILFYAAGFALVPIHGGRAKLSAKESFIVYFETQ